MPLPHKNSGVGASIAIVIIVLLIIVGLTYMLKSKPSAVTSPSTATSTTPVTGTASTSAYPVTSGYPSYYKDTSTWQSATDTNGGYSLAYPPDFSVAHNPGASQGTNWRIGAGTSIGIKYLTLTVPKTFEPQTNFSDATLTIGKSADKTAVANCLVAANGETEAGATIFINDISFNVFTDNDAGAGNIYNVTSYRTVHNNQCYALEYTIHSTQLANYPASANLTQFDMDKVQSTLDLIVSTFRFVTL